MVCLTAVQKAISIFLGRGFRLEDESRLRKSNAGDVGVYFSEREGNRTGGCTDFPVIFNWDTLPGYMDKDNNSTYGTFSTVNFIWKAL